MGVTPKTTGARAAALGTIALVLRAVSDCGAQPAASPYIPPLSSITIRPQTQGPNVSVSVAVDLPDSCHYVGDWGQPTLIGNIANVDTQFWVITNLMCFPVIIAVSTNYNLGALSPGDYTFYFRVWGFQVKARAFSVPEPSPPSLSISRLTDSQARLSWPTNAANYLLECATALPAPEWAAVTNRPQVIGDQFLLTIDLSGGHNFYRLRRP
jgi:hypothetical protein